MCMCVPIIKIEIVVDAVERKTQFVVDTVGGELLAHRRSTVCVYMPPLTLSSQYKNRVLYLSILPNSVSYYY